MAPLVRTTISLTGPWTLVIMPSHEPTFVYHGVDLGGSEPLDTFLVFPRFLEVAGEVQHGLRLVGERASLQSLGSITPGTS